MQSDQSVIDSLNHHVEIAPIFGQTTQQTSWEFNPVLDQSTSKVTEPLVSQSKIKWDEPEEIIDPQPVKKKIAYKEVEEPQPQKVTRDATIEDLLNKMRQSQKLYESVKNEGQIENPFEKKQNKEYVNEMPLYKTNKDQMESLKVDQQYASKNSSYAQPNDLVLTQQVVLTDIADSKVEEMSFSKSLPQTTVPAKQPVRITDSDRRDFKEFVEKTYVEQFSKLVKANKSIYTKFATIFVQTTYNTNEGTIQFSSTPTGNQFVLAKKHRKPAVFSYSRFETNDVDQEITLFVDGKKRKYMIENEDEYKQVVFGLFMLQ